MALSGHFMRRILGGGVVSRCCFVESRRRQQHQQLFMQVKSSLTSPRLIISGYTESKHYHAEAEAGGKSVNEGEVEKHIIKKGDIISLNEILFTTNRDYLVKNNNEHVKAEQLKSKVIGIYFLPLYVECPEYSMCYTSLLKDIYDDLLPFHNFEVVLVAITDICTTFKRELHAHPSLTKDPQKHFKDLFSCMPWTAIPFSDVVSRESMQRSFGVHKEYPTVFLVESTGMVLQCNTWPIFLDFGALGYPFSDERIKFMRAEDDAAAKQPSLKTLLASSQRDYVISSKGDENPPFYFWYGRSIDEFEYYLPILAFDRDGRLVRKTMYPTFENMEFPFYAGGLEEEMLTQLTTLLS